MEFIIENWIYIVIAAGAALIGITVTINKTKKNKSKIGDVSNSSVNIIQGDNNKVTQK